MKREYVAVIERPLYSEVAISVNLGFIRIKLAELPIYALMLGCAWILLYSMHYNCILYQLTCLQAGNEIG